MKSAARAFLALLLVLMTAGLGTRPALAQGDDGYEDDQGYPDGAGDQEYDDGGQYAGGIAPDPSSYGEALDPYGTWVDDDQYGHAWQPAVSVGWAPYVDGSWAWTPYGWTWVSDEPWAWTLHYGRWVLLPGGWAWMPGTVWGPAWVDWFSGDGFVGWAPLPPFATQVTIITQFVFVHDHDFCSHDLAHVVVGHRLIPDPVIHRWQHRDGRDGHPPNRQQIEQVAHHPVTRLDHRPPGTVAPGPLGARRLARPQAEPRLGSARRAGQVFGPAPAAASPRERRPTWQEAPRTGVGRREPAWRPPFSPPPRAVQPAPPPTVARGSAALPHPGALGQRRLEHAHAFAGRHDAGSIGPVSPGVVGGR